jgi:hypothetical protein
LERVNKVLVRAGVEQKFLEKSMAIFRRSCEELTAAGKKALDEEAAQIRHLRQSRRALRCSVFKGLVGQLPGAEQNAGHESALSLVLSMR